MSATTKDVWAWYEHLRNAHGFTPSDLMDLRTPADFSQFHAATGCPHRVESRPPKRFRSGSAR